MTALTPATVAATYATRYCPACDAYTNGPCHQCGEPGVPAVGPYAPARSWNGGDSVSTEDDDDLGDEEA